MKSLMIRTLPFTDSADHVSWYDGSTLYEVGQRCGLELSRYAGVQTARSVLGQILFGMAPALITLGINRFLFAKTIIYEVRLAHSADPIVGLNALNGHSSAAPGLARRLDELLLCARQGLIPWGIRIIPRCRGL
jgi:hypothetical protein